jgi:hypothetical protein
MTISSNLVLLAILLGLIYISYNIFCDITFGTGNKFIRQTWEYLKAFLSSIRLP